MRNYSKVGGKIGKPGYRTPVSFRSKVLAMVAKIPKGKTLTYKEVAEMSGNIKAYRAVGNILNKNHDPQIPCHRVIRSDGKIGGYNQGSEKKKKLLKKEGAI
jgi:methylated-DNA-[protein]-cysteine S-methyltransferase